MTPVPDIRTRTDRTLVRRCLGGDELAQTELVRRYRKPMENLVHMMVGNRQTAADLVQEAFFKAFKKLGTFRPDAALPPWLFKIAQRTALDHLRRQELETVSLDGAADWISGGELPPLEIPDPDLTPSRRVVIKEAEGAVEKAIKQLSPRLQACVLLHFVQDKSYEEIGELLDLPAATIRKYMKRAQSIMRKKLFGTPGFTNPPRRPLRNTSRDE
ncbi:MAG: RNA polymerase sigma factor [Gemmatimonadetes bacterium]|nr:RNA polymerase sigma factor [Gemmatimonadota bacterium]